jgi:prepilin-type processing-associated H-X9-DG protein
MKQIGLALMMYVQDYDEVYFRYYQHTTGGFTPYGASAPQNCYVCLLDVLQPYVKNGQIFRCPSTNRTGTSLATLHADYAMNCQLSAVSMANVQSAAEVPAIAETTCHYFNPVGCWTRTDRTPNPGYRMRTPPQVASAAHNDGANVTFADGHAKWRSTNDLLDRLWWQRR